jgi:hypothetical protein
MLYVLIWYESALHYYSVIIFRSVVILPCCFVVAYTFLYLSPRGFHMSIVLVPYVLQSRYLFILPRDALVLHRLPLYYKRPTYYCYGLIVKSLVLYFPLLASIQCFTLLFVRRSAETQLRTTSSQRHRLAF